MIIEVNYIQSHGGIIWTDSFWHSLISPIRWGPRKTQETSQSFIAREKSDINPALFHFSSISPHELLKKRKTNDGEKWNNGRNPGSCEIFHQPCWFSIEWKPKTRLMKLESSWYKHKFSPLILHASSKFEHPIYVETSTQLQVSRVSSG